MAVNNFISATLSQTFGYAFGRFATVFKAAAIPTLIFSFFMFYYFLPNVFGGLMDLIAIAETDPEDPTAVLQMLGSIAGPTFFAMILGLLYYGVVFSPIIQNILYDTPVGLLRVDGSAFRIIGALFVIYLIMVVAVIAIAIPLAILQVVLLGMSGGETNMAGELIVNLVMMGAIIYLLVRTSMIIPDMAAQDRFRIMHGFRISSGNTGKLFVAFLVTYIAVTILTYIAMGIALFVAAIGFQQSVGVEQLQNDDLSMQALVDMVATLGTSPMGILAIIIYSFAILFSMGVYAAFLGFAYRNLSGGSP